MKNRPITLKKEIERIIAKAEVCTLSMVDTDGKPYAVPMNFGYHQGVFYLHSAPAGKKIELLKNNPVVHISLSTDHELRWQSEKVACSYSMRYRSVFAFGKAEFLEDSSEKIEALNHIMHHYTDRSFTYNQPAVNGVCVFRVKAEKLEARAYGY
ncbi:MAG: pyridoxamine 5'-phosphate oxidase family protein [Bacteroidales bacterium]